VYKIIDKEDKEKLLAENIRPTSKLKFQHTEQY